MESQSNSSFLSPKFENIPEALKAQPWAVWLAEARNGQPGKFSKAPRSPKNGRMIGADKPHLFGTFNEAKTAFESGKYTGVGVLLKGSGIVGFDIDNAAQLISIHPELKAWLSRAFNAGAYCEKSPSGKGLRLFALGSLPAGGKKHGGLEVYDNSRFLTVTGHIYPGKNGGK